MTVTTVARSQFKSFLNTGTTLSPVWSVVGSGVTTGKIAYNPKTLQEIYIDQTTGVTEVQSYMPNYPIEATCKQGDPVYNLVDNLRVNRSILDAAHVDMLNVWLYETPVSGQYPAERQSVSIQIESFGGDGGVVNKIAYQLNFLGASIQGFYNPVSGVFTPVPILASLSSLVLGAGPLVLSPVFSSSQLFYTTTTVNSTDTITAVANNGGTIVIKNGVTTVTNGGSATWVTGANTVTVQVTVGTEVNTYTIIVTK
jgi:hypothetical protein